MSYWMNWPDPIREIFKDTLMKFFDKDPLLDSELALLKKYVKSWITDLPFELPDEIRNLDFENMTEQGLRDLLKELLDHGVDPL